jgi:hypothetical protein
MNSGKIVQVIGPVVDVQFAEGAVPPILQALTIDFVVGGKPEKLTLEVQQHLGGGLVRAIAMSSSEGLKRGMPAVDTGSPITVPVGNGVLGRIFDVTGTAREALPDPSLGPDDRGAGHQGADPRDGHQGHRSDLPVHQGRQGWCLRRCRRRQDRRYPRAHQQHRQGPRWLLRVRRRR